MPDWTKSMQQTFEYYIVDPGTWRDSKKLNNVKSCTIDRDTTASTLGSATIDITEAIDECYVRIYLITIQNGIREKFPLGTFLVQTPSSKHNGKIINVSLDAYTPLIELKENPPPLGYSIFKNENIMSHVCSLTQEHARAPIVETKSDETLYYDFVANTDDTWLSFIFDLMGRANYIFDLDEMGRILFSPKQDTASLRPVWTYTDDNCSILYPEFDIERDLYGIPNAVEVVYSNGSESFYAKVVNDDENSPISTINRGREILRRFPNPDFGGVPTESQVEEYAEQLLRDLSTLEYTIAYSHGYCPVRPNDCVRLDISKIGLTNVKAKVVNQSIKCKSGCQVTETAVFTHKLWR